MPGWPYSATSRWPGNRTWPPPGSCAPVSATPTLAASRRAGPNREPTAMTRPGRAAARAAMAAGSARGSSPRTSITWAPATRAVAATAAATAPEWPRRSSTTSCPAGTGARVDGRPAGRLTTRTRPSCRASAVAGHPGRQHRVRVQVPDLLAQRRLAPCGPRRGEQQRRVRGLRPRGRLAEAAPAAGAADHHDRRGGQQLAGQAGGERVGAAAQHRGGGRDRPDARGQARVSPVGVAAARAGCRGDRDGRQDR